MLNCLDIGHAKIDQVLSIAKQYGSSGKLTGAGGGGIVVIFVANERGADLLEELAKQGFTHFTVQLGVPGVTSILSGQWWISVPVSTLVTANLCIIHSKYIPFKLSFYNVNKTIEQYHVLKCDNLLRTFVLKFGAIRVLPERWFWNRQIEEKVLVQLWFLLGSWNIQASLEPYIANPLLHVFLLRGKKHKKSWNSNCSQRRRLKTAPVISIGAHASGAST